MIYSNKRTRIMDREHRASFDIDEVYRPTRMNSTKIGSVSRNEKERMRKRLDSIFPMSDWLEAANIS